jgi:hypothetical protein
VGAAVRVDSQDDSAQACYSPDAVECVDLKLIPEGHPFGRVSVVSGEGAFRFIERTVRIVETEPIEPDLVEHVNGRAHDVPIMAGIASPQIDIYSSRGDYDTVVAMYHDQGRGPIKVPGQEAGVNITVGLPVIRISVDHCTALDIAGNWIVDERNLIEALRQVAGLAPRRAPREWGRAALRGKEWRALLLETPRTGEVNVADLAERFGVSASNVWRDLQHLASTLGLRRTYGGAMLAHAVAEQSLSWRRLINGERKAAIARAAPRLLTDDILTLDDGSMVAAFGRLPPSPAGARRIVSTQSAWSPLPRRRTLVTDWHADAGVRVVRDGL